MMVQSIDLALKWGYKDAIRTYINKLCASYKMNLDKIDIEEIFDVIILKHGFDEHNRDYLFQIETNWINDNQGNYLLRFKNCVQLECRLNSDGFHSLDWSGTAVMAYPGFKKAEESEKATELSKKIGMELNEVRLATELYNMTLISSGFELKKINNSSDLIDKFVFKID